MRALIFLLALLAGGASAWAVVPVLGRPVVASGIVHRASFNGKDVLEIPRFRDAYKFLVSLRIETSKGYGYCTGALIDSGFILTAAHCVDGSMSIDAFFFSYDANKKLQHEMKPTRGYRVLPNWHLGVAGGAHLPPEISNRRLDFALVLIDDIPHYTQPIPLAAANSEIVSSVYALGLDSLPAPTPAYEATRMVVVSVHASTLNPGTSSYTAAIPVMNPPKDPKVAPKRTVICRGDSGGPIVKVENDQLVLIGVARGVVLLNDSLIDPHDRSSGKLSSRGCGDFLNFHNISMRHSELGLLSRGLLKIPGSDGRK